MFTSKVSYLQVRAFTLQVKRPIYKQNNQFTSKSVIFPSNMFNLQVKLSYLQMLLLLLNLVSLWLQSLHYIVSEIMNLTNIYDFSFDENYLTNHEYVCFIQQVSRTSRIKNPDKKIRIEYGSRYDFIKQVSRPSRIYNPDKKIRIEYGSRFRSD